MILLRPAHMLHHLYEQQGLEGQALVIRLIELFLETTPPLLTELRGAIDSGHTMMAHIILMRLKGSSAVLGDERVSAVCAQLDEQLQTRQANLWADLVLLETEYKAFCSALSAELAVLRALSTT